MSLFITKSWWQIIGETLALIIVSYIKYAFIGASLYSGYKLASGLF